MDLERLKQIIAAYGADPDRWPAEERPAAEALLRRSSQAQACLAEEARLDALLDEIPAGEVSPALAARIVAALPAEPAVERSQPAASLGQQVRDRLSALLDGEGGMDWLAGGGMMRPASLLGGAALLGLATGLFAPAALTSVGGGVGEAEIWELALMDLGSAFEESGLPLEGDLP